jgi:hypothetical protein
MHGILGEQRLGRRRAGRWWKEMEKEEEGS